MTFFSTDQGQNEMQSKLGLAHFTALSTSSMFSRAFDVFFLIGSLCYLHLLWLARCDYVGFKLFYATYSKTAQFSYFKGWVLDRLPFQTWLANLKLLFKALYKLRIQHWCVKLPVSAAPVAVLGSMVGGYCFSILLITRSAILLWSSSCVSLKSLMAVSFTCDRTSSKQ